MKDKKAWVRRSKDRRILFLCPSAPAAPKCSIRRRKAYPAGSRTRRRRYLLIAEAYIRSGDRHCAALRLKKRRIANWKTCHFTGDCSTVPHRSAAAFCSPCIPKIIYDVSCFHYNGMIEYRQTDRYYEAATGKISQKPFGGHLINSHLR